MNPVFKSLFLLLIIVPVLLYAENVSDEGTITVKVILRNGQEWQGYLASESEQKLVLNVGGEKIVCYKSAIVSRFMLKDGLLVETEVDGPSYVSKSPIAVIPNEKSHTGPSFYINFCSFGLNFSTMSKRFNDFIGTVYSEMMLNDHNFDNFLVCIT